MFVTALCPSYRRPVLLANALQLWLDQNDRKREACELLILDDSGIFNNHERPDQQWRLISESKRYPSLPAKYNRMVELADPRTDAFLVWEDDDIYLEDHLYCYRDAFKEGYDLVKPAMVYSDYNRRIELERASGRFHASLGFTKKLLEKVGGWPVTDRADFDQILIANLMANKEKLWEEPFPGSRYTSTYIFSWHTSHPHGQHAMKSPHDTDWYKNAEHLHKPVEVENRHLRPLRDHRTMDIFEMLERHLNGKGM